MISLDSNTEPKQLIFLSIKTPTGDLDTSIDPNGRVRIATFSTNTTVIISLSREQTLQLSKNLITIIDAYDKEVSEKSISRDLL